MSIRYAGANLAAALLLALAAAAAQADDDAVEAEYQQLRKTHAPALVTVRFVQKTQGSYGDFEGENEINGVMIEPTGLVLCSNTMLGGMHSRFGEGRAVPTDIKVLIGDDTEGRPAKFIARDTELDLAWLQIKDPGDRRFACLDLPAAVEAGVKLKLGQRLLALGVMGRYFGQEVLVSEGYIAGRTHKPRDLYVVRGALDTDPGLPVFTARGELAGFACIQQPDADEISGNPANMLARGRGLILPVETVAKATASAKQVRAAEDQEAEQGTPEDAPEPGTEDPAEG
jgi:S1-C subfamily serine protease